MSVIIWVVRIAVLLGFVALTVYILWALLRNVAKEVETSDPIRSIAMVGVTIIGLIFIVVALYNVTR